MKVVPEDDKPWIVSATPDTGSPTADTDDEAPTGREADRLAVLAFRGALIGLLAFMHWIFVPVALAAGVLGGIALRRIERTGGMRRRTAVRAIAIACVGVLAPALVAGTTWLILREVEHALIYEGDAEVTDYTLLQPGQCIQSADGVTTILVTRQCRFRHTAEVYARTSLPQASDVSYPGDDAVLAAATSACREPFRQFLDPPVLRVDGKSVAVTSRALPPGEQAWEDGARTVVCVASITKGRLKSTMADANGS